MALEWSEGRYYKRDLECYTPIGKFLIRSSGGSVLAYTDLETEEYIECKTIEEAKEVIVECIKDTIIELTELLQ